MKGMWLNLKKTYKIIAIVLVLLLITITMQNYIYAGSITDPISNPSAYDPTQTNVETTKLSGIVKTLVKIMTTLGIGVALVSLMVIGIRFMAGSMEDRAKYKETMIPYIIGIVMVIAISTIIKIMSALFFNI